MGLFDSLESGAKDLMLLSNDLKAMTAKMQNGGSPQEASRKSLEPSVRLVTEKLQEEAEVPETPSNSLEAGAKEVEEYLKNRIGDILGK